MSDNQQNGVKNPDPGTISPLTQVPATPQALIQGEEDPDAYGAPKKPSVFSPFDKEALQFGSMAPTNAEVTPSVTKNIFQNPPSGEFSFGKTDYASSTSQPGRTSSVPVIHKFKVSPEGKILSGQIDSAQSSKNVPTTPTFLGFSFPEPPSRRPTPASTPESSSASGGTKTPAQSSKPGSGYSGPPPTPSRKPPSSTATGLTVSVSKSKDLVRPVHPFAESSNAPSTPLVGSTATPTSVSTSGPRILALPVHPFAGSSNVPSTPLAKPAATSATRSSISASGPKVLTRPVHPFAESSKTPSIPLAKPTASPATGSSTSTSGQNSSRPRRTWGKASPAYVTSGPSTPPPYPMPSTYSRENYNPNIPYVPTAAAPLTGNMPYTPESGSSGGVLGSSTQGGLDVANAASTTQTAVDSVTTVENIENNGKTKGKNKPNALPKTWNGDWFDNPLPGPKPEWSYAMPKEEPKMSRVYRTDGTDKFVFVSQDDAPYTAMGTSWAEDKQAHARFIMRRIKEYDMTREQAEAEYKQYLNSQQFLDNRNTRPTPRRHSIIPDTVETILVETGVDKATVNWFFNSFSTMTGTIGYYTKETYAQTRALLGHLLGLLTGLWTACSAGFSWLLEQLYSVRWWLLTTVVVFVVVFGALNDWLGSLGLHQYHIPTILSSDLSRVMTTLPVISEAPLTQSAIASANDINTPFVTSEAVKTSEIKTSAIEPETLTTHLARKLNPTSPNQRTMLMLGKAVLSIPLAAISSIKTIWSSASSANISSSTTEINPRASSRTNLSSIMGFVSSMTSQFFEWFFALVIFIKYTRTVSFITDLRVVVAIICVIATFGLYYVCAARLGSFGNAALVKAGSVLSFTKNLATLFALTMTSFTTETIWPAIANKYAKVQLVIRKGWRIIKSIASKVPRKFIEFIFNIPYMLIWILANPWTSVKSFGGNSFVYVGTLFFTIVTALTTCVSWPFVKTLKLVNWIFRSLKSVSQTSWTWTKKQYALLKVKMSIWIEREWPTMWSILSWFGWVMKWSFYLGVCTIAVFTMGLGWRDIYEGFEKVIIEVAPC